MERDIDKFGSKVQSSGRMACEKIKHRGEDFIDTRFELFVDTNFLAETFRLNDRRRKRKITNMRDERARLVTFHYFVVAGLS